MTSSDSSLLQFAVDLGEYRLPLGPTCVGATLEFSVDDRSMELILPKLKSVRHQDREFFETDFGGRGVHPDVYKETYRGLEPYGFVFRHSVGEPNGGDLEFLTERLLLATRYPIQPSHVESLVRSVEQVCWGMVDWLEVLTFRDYSKGSVTEHRDAILAPYFVGSQGPPERVEIRSRPTLILLDRKSSSVSIEVLNTGLRFSLERKQIDPIHALLISALRHLNLGNYRGTVFDAATAVEMGLTRIMADLLEPMGKAISDIYFHRNIPVKKLRDDIGRLSGEAPLEAAALETKISAPRNKAIHRGEHVTEQEAFAAINLAKAFVYDRFPPTDSERPLERI